MTSRYFVWWASFLIGFTSLTLEIVWIRIVSFVEGNSPQVLALVLGIYLAGIGSGAWIGRTITSQNNEENIRKYAGRILAITVATDLLSPIFIGFIGNEIFIMPILACLILISSTTKAVIFPVVHHLGSKSDSKDTGRSLSKVYFFNILGSSLGPLIIGFWALDWLSSQQIMIFASLLSLLIAASLDKTTLMKLCSTASIITAATIILCIEPHFMMKGLALAKGSENIEFFSENKYGIIHTIKNSVMGDSIYGGNVYDGRLSIDPIKNGNRIDRLLVIAGLNIAPKRALVIGLSGGAWVRVLMEFPSIERIDVIELNPSYKDLIATTPTIGDILKDPRVHLHFNDGRKWLKGYEDAKFDLAVMNTTFHWRAYITNLLSVEFLNLISSNLGEHGILAYNSTGSPDALYTAAHVFQHAYTRSGSNFIYAADWDFRKTPLNPDSINYVTQRLVNNMGNKADTSIVFNQITSGKWVSKEVLQTSIERDMELITDQNMVTEFRHSRK